MPESDDEHIQPSSENLATSLVNDVPATINGHNDALEDANATETFTNGTPQSPKEEVMPSHEEGSVTLNPGKKRKFVGTPTKSSTPRAISPPWKKFSAEGPTSFTVDGKRKSSRTNTLPMNMQPGADRRRHTRAQLNQTPTGKGKKGKNVASSPASAPQTRRRSTVKDAAETMPPPPRSAGKTAQIPQPIRRGPGRPRKETVSSTLASIPPTKPVVPYTGKRRGRPPKNRPPEEAQPKEESDLQRDDDIPGASQPRLKLKLRRLPPRPLEIRHYLQVPKATTYASFDEWYKNTDLFEGEPDSERPLTEAAALEEANIRRRILDAAQPGGLLSKDKCSVYLDASDEPPETYRNWDHIVAHAINFQGLLQKESQRHRQLAKKIAQEAAAYVRSVSKTVTREQLDKEEEKRALVRYKQVVRDIRSLWKNVGVDVHKLRLGRWEEEQHELGKQALDEMLDQSTVLLNQRMRQGSEDNSDDTSDGGEEDEEDDNEEADDGADMDDVAVASDDDLTREQLEEKYRKILGYSRESSEDGVEEFEDDNEEDEDQRDAVDGDEEDEEAADERKADTMDLDINDSTELDDPGGKATNDELDPAVEKLELGELDETELGPRARNDETEGEQGALETTHTTGNAQEMAAKGDAHLSPEELLAKYRDLMARSMDDVFAEAGIDDNDHGSFSDDDSGSSTEASSDEGDADEDDDEEDENSEDEADGDPNEAPTNMLGFYMSKSDLASADDTPLASSPEKTHLTNAHLDIDARPPSPISLDKNMREESIDQETMEPLERSENLDDEGVQAAVSGAANDLTEPTHDEVISLAEDLPVQGNEEAIPEAHTSNMTDSRQNTPESMDGHMIKNPTLLRGKLRAYQHDGLDWLANLWVNGTNGILADEMGLGKTIQTIALLAHLADRGEWGPHLVVVPTSVMLNWEIEFKKFCPGFKILTYYGTQEERKNKRRGWYNSHLHQVGNVVITSYQLILQDELAFKKRDWYYLVLDEAHNIKNFQSQRWQALLKFKTQRRLLLTGTPLQNSIQELWSLLYFLMPSGDDGEGGFAGLDNFTQALKRPTNQILEQGRNELDAAAQKAVTQLHTVLRPYLLRRLKADVEKQMPAKYEHVVYCRLSKRQRQLYDGFMGRADTRQTLSGGNYMSIMNCLMSLRKVCNHPDLFETRQIRTSFAMRKPVAADYEIKDLLVRRRLFRGLDEDTINLDHLNLRISAFESRSKYHTRRAQYLRTDQVFDDLIAVQTRRLKHPPVLDGSIDSGLTYVAAEAEKDCLDGLRRSLLMNQQRSAMVRTWRGLELMPLPLYGSDLVRFLDLNLPNRIASRAPRFREDMADWYLCSSDTLRESTLSIEQRSEMWEPYISRFACITPNVVANGMAELTLSEKGADAVRAAFPPSRDAFHESRVRLSIAFPDKRLLQFDCGKLQRLAELLRRLTSEGHRALIFTQMTKVLDILEEFLNVHGYKYLRLDGSTPIEKRQLYTSQFNQDPRIPVFILSSRSGGLGLNLTGADTVIFYDLDWNPAMDRQCQDRAHRIGQTRDVHIYRFVSEYTIETNILRKSNQKRLLDDVIIQKGDFTTDYFNRVTYADALTEAEKLGELDNDASAAMDRVLGNIGGVGKALEQVEDKEDVQALETARKEEVEEVREDEADFDETETKETLEKKEGKSKDSEECGHVDDWMVRHLDWEMRDTPIVMERKNTKKGTKGVLGARRKR